MKVIVFGATGQVGVHLLEQALNQGHEVTAFTRSSDKLRRFASRARIVEGDVFDLESVKAAVSGQDAVLCSLGNGRFGRVRAEGTNTIVMAMQATGVSRLICQTTLGAGASCGNLNFFWKYFMFGWFLRDVLADHEEQENIVHGSGLDWTIVRPGSFTQGELTGRYRHGFEPHKKGLSLKISCADVAHFMLK